MERLIQGYKRFRAEVFPERKCHFHLLAQGQAPEWLIITCADSRVLPTLILGIEPGDMFITRSIGNIVPPAGEPANGTGATVEYAVEALGVRHAIVLGHSDCGAMKAALAPEGLNKLPLSQQWLHFVQPAHEHKQPLNPEDGESAELASLIRGNVVTQLEHLRQYTSVSRAIAEKRLTIHGWYYDIMKGEIECYDERRKRFVALK